MAESKFEIEKKLGFTPEKMAMVLALLKHYKKENPECNKAVENAMETAELAERHYRRRDEALNREEEIY